MRSTHVLFLLVWFCHGFPSVLSAQSSQEGFDALRASFHAYRESEEYKQQRLAEDVRSSLMYRLGSPVLIQRLKKIFDTPALVEMFEFTEAQQDKVPTILNSILELDARQADVDQRIDPATYKHEREKLVVKLLDTNIQSQTIDMTSLNIDTGLYKTLYQSELLRDYLKMSDAQFTRVREKSDRLATEMAEHIREFRLKSAELLKQELTGEQKEKLIELYGHETINNSFGRIPVENLVMTMFGFENQSEAKKALGQMRWMLNTFRPNSAR